MSNKYQARCGYCNRFVKWNSDSYTPYGCEDPGAPEPYDPVYMCKKHEEEHYLFMLKGFTSGGRSGDWYKSRAEIRAAKEAGLVWVHKGLGEHGTEGYVGPHQYVTQEEYEELGWCNCGSFFGGAAMTPFTCQKCGEGKVHSNTFHPKWCDTCAFEAKVCGWCLMKKFRYSYQEPNH